MPRKTRYKRIFEKVNGVCENCGRETPPCACGQAIMSVCCPFHPKEHMRILAIPLYYDGDICGWVDVAECVVKGCTRARSLKHNFDGSRKICKKKGEK